MNGYFQIAVNEQGTSVRLIPPTDGGEKIQVNELKSYLERIGVPYNVMAINSALYQLKEEEVVLFLNSVKINNQCICFLCNINNSIVFVPFFT